jgi:hypothetical protein
MNEFDQTFQETHSPEIHGRNETTQKKKKQKMLVYYATGDPLQSTHHVGWADRNRPERCNGHIPIAIHTTSESTLKGQSKHLTAPSTSLPHREPQPTSAPGPSSPAA